MPLVLHPAALLTMLLRGSLLHLSAFICHAITVHETNNVLINVSIWFITTTTATAATTTTTTTILWPNYTRRLPQL